MKYLSQLVIIFSVTLAAELIKYLLPLPIPASIYGLVLLFLLLKTGAVKLHQVEDAGNFLLELMPLILVPVSASFIQATGALKEMLLPALIMGFGGTLLVMVVTGRVSQWVIRRRKGEKEHE